MQNSRLRKAGVSSKIGQLIIFFNPNPRPTCVSSNPVYNSYIMDFIPSLAAPSSYIDRRYPGGAELYKSNLAASTTLYIGNLSFYTTEAQIYELFCKVGEVKRLIMGLDKHKKTPCGFCFLE